MSRPLKIAFVVPEDRRTGTYFRFHNLAIALEQLGHNVSVYSQSSTLRLRGAVEIRDGIHYHLSPTVPGNRFILPPTNPLTFCRRLLKRIEEADIYHLFQPYPTAAWLWLWLQKRRSGAFFYDWDDFWINEEFGLKNPRGISARWTARCVSRLERSLPSSAHNVTTVSHALSDLASEWGAPQTKVVHNGVWRQPRAAIEESRIALNLPMDAFYVGLMGWSGELDWCLEAIRRCKDRFPSLRLAITGRDPGGKLAAYPDIADRVHYLGALPDSQFQYFNTALNLGLVPMCGSTFNHYRLPYKLTDHLADGVPVLCSRIGEAIHLANEVDGITLSAPTKTAWIDTFSETVEAMINGRAPHRVSTDRLHKKFSWPAIARNVENAYRETKIPAFSSQKIASHPPHHFS